MLSPAPSLYTETYAGAPHLLPERASTKPWPRSDVIPADAYALCRNTYAMPPPKPAVPACACTLLRGAAEAQRGQSLAYMLHAVQASASVLVKVLTSILLSVSLAKRASRHFLMHSRNAVSYACMEVLSGFSSTSTETP